MIEWKFRIPKCVVICHLCVCQILWELAIFPLSPLQPLVRSKSIGYFISRALHFSTDDHSQQYLIHYYSWIPHELWFSRWNGVIFSFQNLIGRLSNADLWFVQVIVIRCSRCRPPPPSPRSTLCTAQTHLFVQFWGIMHLTQFDKYI